MEVMKQIRQRAIRDLVDQRPIRTQQELAAALRDRGFRTTQATISRDVAELGLIKVTREGTAAYALPPRLIEAETSGEDRLRKLLADLPVELHEAGLLLVLRTLPGSAHAIAAALDRAAGRRSPARSRATTLFVAFPDRGSLQRIKRRLVRLTEAD
jgi:transcriptional regulator of arginine metabolism